VGEAPALDATRGRGRGRSARLEAGDVAGGTVLDAAAEADADALGAARAEVERLVAGGTARGDAARAVAARSGIPRRALYGARAADPAAEDRGDP